MVQTGVKLRADDSRDLIELENTSVAFKTITHRKSFRINSSIILLVVFILKNNLENGRQGLPIENRWKKRFREEFAEDLGIRKER